MTTLPTGLTAEALDRATRNEVARLKAKEAQQYQPRIDDYVRAANAQAARLDAAQSLIEEALAVLEQQYPHDDREMNLRAFALLRDLREHIRQSADTADLDVSTTTLPPDDDGNRWVQCFLYVTTEQARAHRS
jgi:hypothetical protein